MNDSEYQKLYELETIYWWHVGKRYLLAALIRKFIPSPQTQDQKILDVGCGTGENIKFLSRFGKVLGIDNSERAIEFCQKRDLKDVQVGQAENLPFEKSSFDLVTMLDLLEHLEKDLLALKEAFRVLKPNGLLIVTVPSYKFLWSEHDEALNHKRRYSKKELEAKVKKAGFRIKKSSFAITTLFPPIFAWRLFQKLLVNPDKSGPKTSYVILPNWLNEFFIDLLKLEAKLLKYATLPFGVSLVCVAEK